MVPIQRERQSAHKVVVAKRPGQMLQLTKQSPVSITCARCCSVAEMKSQLQLADLVPKRLCPIVENQNILHGVLGEPDPVTARTWNTSVSGRGDPSPDTSGLGTLRMLEIRTPSDC